jgi:DNA processing protein
MLTWNERVDYLRLSLVPGIGPERMRSLIRAYDSLGGAFQAPFASLRAVPGIGTACATAIRRSDRHGAEVALMETEALGGRVLLPMDVEYPQALLDSDEAPLALFAQGDLTLLTKPAVAIVGSRDHTRYGGDVTTTIASRAAQAGLVVVSGMARGLDAVAHEAALRVGGGTIGVLGNGLGVVYPAANRRLYDAVRRDGLLLTEHPPGERPSQGSFPKRNRIIAGLARVTVVVEAGAGSGALITGEAANRLHRDVMVVPGPVTSETSVGANVLIRDGALLMLEMADLFSRYPELQAPLPPEPGRGGREGAVLAALGRGPMHLDELASRAGAAMPELLGVLGVMEIAGLVRQEPGMRYALALPVLAAERRAKRPETGD